MLSDNLKLEIRPVGAELSLEAPQFSVSYGGKLPEEERKRFGFEVLSRMREGKDAIIEIKNSLLHLSENAKREACISDFIEVLQSLKLEYRTRKVPKPDTVIFGAVLNFGKKKNNDATEIMAHIPSGIWKSDDFFKGLPSYGVRYYFIKPEYSGIELLEPLFNGAFSEGEIFKRFEPVVFDCCNIGQMGVNSEKKMEYFKSIL